MIMNGCKELQAALRRGEWVYGFSPEVSGELLRVKDMCHRFNAMLPSETSSRDAILCDILGSMGEGVLIHSPFYCDFGSNIHLGSHVTANYGLTILDEAEVYVGDNVFIGPNVSIYTVAHALDAPQRNVGVMTARPVSIGDDVWIGGDVTILPGVSIGRGAVVGAGSVVTRSVAPLTLVAGNPARVIRKLSDDDRIDESIIWGH